MKRIRWAWGVFVVLIWFLSGVANATLHLELRGGQAAGLPIAIVPFQQEGLARDPMENMADIIRLDLQNSGQFSVTPFQQMRQFPNHSSGVQYPYWQSLGVENLVVGRVKPAGGGMVVNFELLDVIRQKSENITKPLLAVQFDHIQPHEMRALAHHISDLIFEKLIGIKGIFSTRIAYISVTEAAKGKQYTLEVADADGHNPKPLHRSTYPLMSPAWSPDGKRVAFVSFENDRAGINVVEVFTGRVQRITHFPGINGAPAWSPDNQTLAVVLSKDGNPKIYTVNLVTKQFTRVTDGTSIDTEPSFAPDGRSLVFTSNRGGKPQIYRVTLGSGKIERLTFSGDYNAKPTLTPDGKRLVMLHRGENGLFGIAVQSLGSGELRLLTEASLSDSPSLAPNGMMVLYGAKEGHRGVLGAVSLDGRVKIRLPSREGNVQEPAWSPFAFR